MEESTGELADTDVLIEGERIRAIGRNLPAENASIVDASGMILMPGLIDGFRPMWQAAFTGLGNITSFFGVQPPQPQHTHCLSKTLTPEEVYFSSRLGALRAIDNGITSVLDYATMTHSPETAAAAARAMRDSGLGGVFCHLLGNPRHAQEKDHAPDESPVDQHELAATANIRDEYFGSGSRLLFGIALRGPLNETATAYDSVSRRIVQARTLQPHLITQMTHAVAPFDRAGLLGTDLHVCGGNGLDDDQLRMMSDSGTKLCSAVLAEFRSPKAQIHGRARSSGVDAGIGSGASMFLPSDYFEHIRNAFWSLGRTRESTNILAGYSSTDTLAFATSLGAKALGIGNQTGSIQVGKRADLLLLRTDRIGFPSAGGLADRVAGFASHADIDSVWLAGNLRKSAGKLHDVVWRTLKHQALTHRNSVLARMRSS